MFCLALLVLSCAGCSMSEIGETATASSPDPQPGDMSAIHGEVKKAFAALKLAGRPEISDIHRNRGPFLSEWAMCMRNDAAERKYYTFFFSGGKVSEYRLSVIVDGCEQEAYRKLPS